MSKKQAPSALQKALAIGCVGSLAHDRYRAVRFSHQRFCNRAEQQAFEAGVVVGGNHQQVDLQLVTKTQDFTGWIASREVGNDRVAALADGQAFVVLEVILGVLDRVRANAGGASVPACARSSRDERSTCSTCSVACGYARTKRAAIEITRLAAGDVSTAASTTRGSSSVFTRGRSLGAGADFSGESSVGSKRQLLSNMTSATVTMMCAGSIVKNAKIA